MLEGVDEENLSEVEFEELPSSRNTEFQEVSTCIDRDSQRTIDQLDVNCSLWVLKFLL